MRRGKQSEKAKARDDPWRQEINKHIERFPELSDTTSKQYLHSNLTLPKMHAMFIDETSGNDKPSYSTYSILFSGMNSVFTGQRKTSEPQKEKLRFATLHTLLENKKVRVLKTQCKEMSKVYCVQHLTYNRSCIFPFLWRTLFPNNGDCSATISHSTMLQKGACDCFLWHEGQSKRGSSEICTTVYSRLTAYDHAEIRKAYMFSDGCPSQIKNSVFPTMMLYFMNIFLNLQELSFRSRYFESFHGQNEGDSVYSALATVMKHAGEFFEPCQLLPIFKLARRKCSV